MQQVPRLVVHPFEQPKEEQQNLSHYNAKYLSNPRFHPLYWQRAFPHNLCRNQNSY